MFETAELGRKLSKEEYAAELPAIRARLLAAQFALRSTKVPVIVVIAGADGSGKGDTVNRLLEWLDPRGVETNVFGPRTDEERDRPAAWRFWRTLPARGRIGIFFGSWYTEPILKRTTGKIGGARFEADLARVAFFEKELARDGALLVKCWFHLSKDAQKKRLKKFEKDPETRFKVSRLDWKHFGHYDTVRRTSPSARSGRPTRPTRPGRSSRPPTTAGATSPSGAPSSRPSRRASPPSEAAEKKAR